MMTAWTILLASMAVYRLARMVAIEPGPYLFRSEPRGIFARLRAALITDYDQDGEPANFWGALLSCPWCLSVWMGIAATLWIALGPAWGWWLFVPFAMSGIAGWFYSQESAE